VTDERGASVDDPAGALPFEILVTTAGLAEESDA
jgi:hypothetical protein